MSTKATKNFIGVYAEILEHYSKEPFDQLMCSRLSIVDEIAERCLTFTEYCDYHKTTVKMFNDV